MKLIERVARAMCRADPDVRRGDAEGVVEHRVVVEWPHYVPQAKPAIRAVLDGVEPVAWRYDKGALAVVFIHRQNDMDHWTETPLYSLDALKEAAKP